MLLLYYYYFIEHMHSHMSKMSLVIRNWLGPQNNVYSGLRTYPGQQPMWSGTGQNWC